MVTNLLLYLLQTGIHKDLLGHHNSLLEMAKVCIYCRYHTPSNILDENVYDSKW